MADPQLAYSFAWALEIIGPATVRGATTDLPEDAARTTLGDFYTKRLMNIDAVIRDGLPNYFYGVRRRAGIQLILDNSDGAMDATADWRLAPFTLWHYDRNLDVKRTDLTGLVTDAQFANGRATFTLSTVNDAILRDPLPAATIDPKPGSPFDDSASPGVPLPVVFGSDVLIRPPSLNVDNATEGQNSFWDYCAGFTTDIVVRAMWGDIDTYRAGLERLGSWENAPGTPTYLSSELDPLIRAVKFSVTGNQSVRYHAGQPIRFKTTASGSSTYLYGTVKAYHAGSPNLVEVYTGPFDSGLNGVQLLGDYDVVYDVYTTVTEGILPEPATEQTFTAIRLFGQEDMPLVAMVSNPNYQSGSGGALPSDIIQDIITDNVWGLSTHVQQTTNALSFAVADIALSLAGLGGAVQGALGYDGRQRPAEQVLDELLMIARGGRLGQLDGQWTLTVDVQQASVATFCWGPGEESGPRIKRVLSYGRQPVEQAVRNLVLHWSPIARAKAASDKVNPLEYARFSTKAVSGIGQDRHIFNSFIRTETVAAAVLHYMAEKLKGADERLVFVAGQEARDRTPGEVITCISTVDGFSGDWQISEVARSLIEVTLSCIRHNTDAYDTPSGITTSSEPSETPNTRTDPGPGPNLLPNPEPAPPLGRYEFHDTIYAVPDQWSLSGGSGLSELTIDRSEAVRSRTVSGHYCRMVYASVQGSSGGMGTSAPDGIYSAVFRVRQGDHLFSFYGDAEDGWFVHIDEDDGDNTQTVLSLTRDSTDTDGNGWARLYGRWRPQSDTTRAFVSICASAAGTYQWSSAMLEPVNASARKPSGWRRNSVTPITLTRTQAVSFDGSTSYTIPLIKAGDYVIGATLRVAGTITGGTHTYYAIGTENDSEVYGSRLQLFLVGDATSSVNFKSGTIATFFAGDANIVLTFNGTVTSGSAQVVLEYTRSAPTPGA